VQIVVIAEAGGGDQAEELVSALASEGVDAEVLDAPAEAEDPAMAALAAALVTFEAKLTAERPDAVVLVGDGARALAAAIVAAKLEIRAFQVGDGEGANGLILGILAERTVVANPAQAAEEITAGLLN
jgi:hypothetical protein